MGIYIEKQDIYCTLTTYIYCSFWQMWAFEQTGGKSYINWGDGKTPPRWLDSYMDKKKFKEIPNAYEWYFKQPFYDAIPPCDEIDIWESSRITGQYPFMSQPLSVIKEYYKKNLIFNDETNRRGKELQDKYNIDFNKTIGITWRGTDNVTDGRMRMPIERYYKHIDSLLEKEPDLRIAVTTEEAGVEEPLLARYPSAFKVHEFYQSPLGSLQNPERFSPMSGYERGLQAALMVWLFSKCAYYIKNRSSTGAVASWLSDGTIISLGHAETLNYDKLDDEDEINGIRYKA